MKRQFFIVATAAFMLAGCNPVNPRWQLSETEAVQRAEQQLAEERALRVAAEERSKEQEARATRWQCAAIIGFALSAVTLILGIILGSRARHDGKP